MLLCGRFNRITVSTDDPYAMYPTVPIKINRTVAVIMTKPNTSGNFSGCFMESCTGMINPIPSNAKIAVPINIVQRLELNPKMVPRAGLKFKSNDKCLKLKAKTIINPVIMKKLANKDGKDSLETFLMKDKGIKTINCNIIK